MRPDPLPGSPGGVAAGPTAGPLPHRPGLGHHAEVPFLGPRPPADPPRHPNPSQPGSAGAPRWFGRLVIAGAVVALGAAVLWVRAEDAERDARVSDLTSEFTTEACTP